MEKHTIIFDSPRKIEYSSAWIIHTPFAFFLISILRPKVFVELGVHTDYSYNAFCQAVKTLKTVTKCYGIDTWKGDKHASFYGEDVYHNLVQYQQREYSEFSHLFRMTFDEALTKFSDNSIDLLHIDGLHTYEAVKHNFESWLPKMSEKGVILLHDTMVRERDFGVWKLWEEIATKYPSFNFTDGYGLGITAVGSNVSKEFLDFLKEANASSFYQKLFFRLGMQCSLEGHIGSLEESLKQKEEQIANPQNTLKDFERKSKLQEQQIASLENAVREKKAALAHIYNSHGWKGLLVYYKLRDKILPANSRRRDFAKKIFKLMIDHIMNMKALKILFQQGPRALFTTILSKLKLRNQYKWYLRNLKKLEDSEDAKRDKAKVFQYRPKVSILVPVYNTDEKWLRLCIESVLNQVYDNWELCIVDGGSSKSHIRKALEEYNKQDNRIKVKFLLQNKGIAGNSNEALALATGEFVGLLDHDDELEPSALYEVVELLNKNPDLDFIYTDEDKITTKGKRFDPHFKPDWSPDTMRSYNYITHFAVIRKKVIDEGGGFREGYEGSQDYGLFLRVIEHTQRIAHIPKVLYHWRCHEFSAAGNPNAKLYAYESAKKALKEHIQRIGLNGEVCDGLFLSSYRIRYHIDASPIVSIIIPTKDKVELLKKCINSIVQKSSYGNYMIYIVDNQSSEEETFRYYNELQDEHRIKILRYDKPFNFSAINNYVVSQIDSEYIIFLNNDIEVISPDWIEAMLEFAQREDVGVVGALLYYPNDTIQHAGVIIGIGGVASHSHKHFLRNAYGYVGRAKIIQNLSAVTGACMMIKKDVFKRVLGFDESFQVAFGDIDLCLKVREKGYLIVYTPYAELYHHESLTRGYEDTPEKQARFMKEVEYFQRKWKDVLLKGDPYYNPNLTLDREDFSIRIYRI